MSAYYSLVVIGLCLLMGYAGQISLGQAGFFAMGGYIAAALSKADLTPWAGTGAVRLATAVGLAGGRSDLYGREALSLSPWIGFCAAILATAAVAWIIGGPITRLRGHYLAMATLGLGVIVYRVALGTPALGEADGLSDVPGLPLLAGLEVTGKAGARVGNYYVAWCVVAAAMVLSTNLIDSRVGRALRSIHGSEEAANTLGVDTGRYKLWTFVTSAVLAALGGVLLTHYNAGIGPSESSAMKSVRYLAIVAAGGMDNLWGALLMGTVLNYLSLRGTFGSLDDAVFGGILIIVMLFAPRGLLRPGRLAGLGWLPRCRPRGRHGEGAA
jgi:branched-chain amino acid transport system permease protein